MNFVFSNLLGAPYRGGTLLIHDNQLLTPVGNRVGQVNLTQSTSQCLPFENLTQVRVLSVSPDGQLLLSVDKDGRALLVNRRRNALLHHFSFKKPVTCARFSPDGKYVAVATGRLVQVWVTPSLDKQTNPMQLHRTYGQCHTDVLDVAWSPDGAFLAAASKDIVIRIFSLDPIPGYEPPALAGHKDSVVGVFFTHPDVLERGMPDGGEVPIMWSLSADGALHAWSYAAAGSAEAAYTLGNLTAAAAKRKREEKKRQQQQEQEEGQEGQEGEEAAEEEEEDGEEGRGRKRAGREASTSGEQGEGRGEEQGAAGGQGRRRFPWLAGGKWLLSQKHYFHQRGARLSSYAQHGPSGLLAVGFTNGVFDLYGLPSFDNLHTLSVSRERITSLAFNGTGDWLAVGCAALGQLLVWEWRSETYVLKQQGHHHDVAATAFSPDGALVATGADDCKVKLFQLSSGFCFVTFSEHTAPVTALAFLPSGHALLSSSLDGTVRAWDLVRYRCFRTLTTPQPVQFGSLAVDPGGELVCAGAVDTFEIFVWSLKTGRLLERLAGHEGPVCCLGFSPAAGSLLVSGSWDRTLRTWDVYEGGAASDTLEHRHDVLALAMRPDGRMVASAALDGSIYLWDPVEGQLLGTIEGRRDIRGGRLASDRRAAANSSSGAAFTSLAFSADGSLLLAGGASKHVCLYDVAERVLLRRFTLSHNRSLDGVLDVLNSKNMTDAGPLQLIDHDDKGRDDMEMLAPTTDLAASADVPGTSAGKRPVLRCRAVALSPTGRCWAAATTEGLMLYGVDEQLVFDPTDLSEDLTPAACEAAIADRAFLKALLIALRLGDAKLVRHAVMSTPPAAVAAAAAGVPAVYVPTVLTALAEAVGETAHLEFVLGWVKAVCTAHGEGLRAAGSGGSAAGRLGAQLLGGAAGGGAGVMPALRSLQKVLGRLHGDLAATCESNVYALDYLSAAAAAGAGKAEEEEREEEAGQQGAGAKGKEAGAGGGQVVGGKGKGTAAANGAGGGRKGKGKGKA